MIFKPEHAQLILEGKKTQTRRVNRGKYQVGKSYAIQKCRTCKGIDGYRIVMDRIWEECCHEPEERLWIFTTDAYKEGGYTPEEFENLFIELNPKWNGRSRWGFEFHVAKPICKFLSIMWRRMKNENNNEREMVSV